jgi:hypothetical protein
MTKQYGIKNEMLLGTLGNTLGTFGELDENTFKTTKNEKSPPLEIEKKQIKPFQAFQNSSSPFST